MGKYFGTDGIRGKYGEGYITASFAFRMGAALAKYAAGLKPGMPLNVIVGRDTRASGALLSDAIAQGLNSRRVFVHDAGVVPTPAVAQCVQQQSADLGIAITASHNPAQDNGIKLFDASGCKLDLLEEAGIEALIDQEPEMPADLPPAKYYPLDAAGFYINYLSSLLDQNCMSGWRIVLDLANGATAVTSPAVFKRWGAKLHLIGDQPNGKNINLGVGSEYSGALGEAVRRHSAHIGIAHDGDGDRVIFSDENGQVLDGDVVLGIFALYALKSGALAGNTLVSTIQSNLGLDHAIRAAGGQVERVDVGDRNVAHRMRAIGANLGGENSGHIIFSNFSTTGDGLLAAVKLIELMRQTGKPLSLLRQEIMIFPQQTCNLKVLDKIPLPQLPKLSQAIQQIELNLDQSGRVLVRYSGTEPKLRMLVEAKDADAVDQALSILERAARADLHVIDD